MLGKLGIHMQKNEAGPYFTPVPKIDSKWINCTYKTWNYKTPRRTRGEEFHDIGLGNDFMDITPKAQVKNTKIDKRDYIKLTGFLQ